MFSIVTPSFLASSIILLANFSSNLNEECVYDYAVSPKQITDIPCSLANLSIKINSN